MPTKLAEARDNPTRGECRGRGGMGVNREIVTRLAHVL